MKTVEYYMSLPYRLEIIRDTEEGGFTARYPELLGCVTCGETEVDALRNALDAKRAWIEAAIEDGCDIYEPSERGETKDNIKVTAVRPLRDRMMLVTFSTGEHRLFDTTTLRGTAFAPLANEEVFMNPVLFHGVITWKNGEIDIAPETVYKNSYEFQGDLEVETPNAETLRAMENVKRGIGLSREFCSASEMMEDLDS